MERSEMLPMTQGKTAVDGWRNNVVGLSSFPSYQLQFGKRKRRKRGKLMQMALDLDLILFEIDNNEGEKRGTMWSQTSTLSGNVCLKTSVAVFERTLP